MVWLTSRYGARVPVALITVGWLTLGGFYANYFRFFEQTGGTAHRTFHTAATEPKQAAVSHVRRWSDPSEETWIVASEFWNHRPLLYLTGSSGNLRVAKWKTAQGDPAFLKALAEDRVWFVEFAGSEGCEEVRRFVTERGLDVHETSLTDYAGNPLLQVIGPAAAAPRPMVDRGN